VKTKSGSH